MRENKRQTERQKAHKEYARTTDKLVSSLRYRRAARFNSMHPPSQQDDAAEWKQLKRELAVCEKMIDAIRQHTHLTADQVYAVVENGVFINQLLQIEDW